VNWGKKRIYTYRYRGHRNLIQPKKTHDDRKRGPSLKKREVSGEGKRTAKWRGLTRRGRKKEVKPGLHLLPFKERRKRGRQTKELIKNKKESGRKRNK